MKLTSAATFVQSSLGQSKSRETNSRRVCFGISTHE